MPEGNQMRQVKYLRFSIKEQDRNATIIQFFFKFATKQKNLAKLIFFIYL